jgi:hypothetical protein
MTDRELLELAAKAAGYEVRSDGEGGLTITTRIGACRSWNPRDDDGDSRRLEVALGIHVSQQLSYCATSCPHGGAGTRGMTWTEHYNDDPCAATRRAILRAAAEIGRQMEAGNG